MTQRCGQGLQRGQFQKCNILLTVLKKTLPFLTNKIFGQIYWSIAYTIDFVPQ